ncbi:hypothetical protein BDZ94DRAFT_1309035 [Collybia nuda]|uniref:CCHC-type domain-containing protein n=1 Tax=Collybia nuda TaxID=64659 RepID=A0A9P6CEL7_9AGAR|nr:hypothetical protein BDZ94DRAFT_1309035 [Collybia nuda]
MPQSPNAFPHMPYNYPPQQTQAQVMLMPPQQVPHPIQLKIDQALPYAPGIKSKDFMNMANTIGMSITMALANQLQLLFQNMQTNNGQPRQSQYNCNMCGKEGHGVCNCNTTQRYLNKNCIKCDNNCLVMADGSFIPQGNPGKYMMHSIDHILPAAQQCTVAILKIYSLVVQETMQQYDVSMNAHMEDEDCNNTVAEIAAAEFHLFELQRKAKEQFDGIELQKCNKGKVKETPAAPPSNTTPASTSNAAPALANTSSPKCTSLFSSKTSTSPSDTW